MWRALLRGSEWEPLGDLLSPPFFDLLPARTLQRQLQELLGNALRRGELERIRRETGARLAASPIPVRISSAAGTAHMAGSKQGRAVLGVYFQQLLSSDVALLDLRSKRFEAHEDGLLWSPRPLYVRWDPAFLAALRDLYIGHHEGDDTRRDAGLEQLGLGPARGVLLEHFGPSDTPSAFSLAAFRKTFHQVFVRCRDAGVTLHGNVVPFAFYLATLHEHLERLGGVHAVTLAYADARPPKTNVT